MIDRNCSVPELAVRLSVALVEATIYSRHPTWDQQQSRYSCIDCARPHHYTAHMDTNRVDLPSVCQRAADKALAVVRQWWPVQRTPTLRSATFSNRSGWAFCMLTLIMYG